MPRLRRNGHRATCVSRIARTRFQSSPSLAISRLEQAGIVDRDPNRPGSILPRCRSRRRLKAPDRRSGTTPARRATPERPRSRHAGFGERGAESVAEYHWHPARPTRAQAPDGSRTATTSVRHLREPGQQCRHASLFLASGQDPFDHFAEDVREAVIAPLVLVGQSLVVNAQQMEDRGVEIVDVNAVGRRRCSRTDRSRRR